MLREIHTKKRNWGNERTAPEYQISKHERVYRSMLESCMVLDNNKKIHCDIDGEMTATYKGKLDQFLRESKSGIWMKQKMPKIKQRESDTHKRITSDDEDSPEKAPWQVEKKQSSNKLQLKLANAIGEGNIPSREQSSRNMPNIDSNSMDISGVPSVKTNMKGSLAKIAELKQ